MSKCKKAYPVKLHPAFKDYIWGGKKLESLFNKQTDLSPLAESWELSCHPNGISTIATGEYKGCSFKDYLYSYSQKSNQNAEKKTVAGDPLSSGTQCYDTEILGKKCRRYKDFPLLIKFIDAKKDLSIQVHPDDSYARKNEGQNGKTEMWYVVESEPDTYLYCGFSKTISKEEFKQRIEVGTLPEVLNKVPVKKGDVFFIPPGTIHAICAGAVIAEIQQNSDVTYRVFDYNRKDSKGNTRPLHVDKALDVTLLSPPNTDFNKIGNPYKKEGAVITPLKKCEYFDVSLLDISASCTLSPDSDSFMSLLCLEGSCKLSWNDNFSQAEGFSPPALTENLSDSPVRECGHSIDVQKGDSIFIPANCGPIMISGKATAILSKL